MQYYIRGAWRTISDSQMGQQGGAKRVTIPPGPRADPDRKQPGVVTASDRRKEASRRTTAGNVPLKSSDSIKESSAFLRDTEGDWEDFLRRMASSQNDEQSRSNQEDTSTSQDTRDTQDTQDSQDSQDTQDSLESQQSFESHTKSASSSFASTYRRR